MQFIVTHTCAGFDALAAVVAAVKIFPGATGFLPEPLSEKVRVFLNLYRDSLPLGEVVPEPVQPELVVIVDAQEADPLGPYAALARQSRAVYVFDQYRSGGPSGSQVTRRTVEPVGATTTLLVEEIRDRGLTLTELEASLMVLGIFESTGCLVASRTTLRDVEAVLFLWRQGLKQSILQEYLDFVPALNSTLGSPPGLQRVEVEQSPAPPAVPAPAHGDNLLPLFKERLSERWRSLLLLIGQRADRLGAEVYLVGGVIRDLLLGCALSQDLDCVVLPEAALLARDLQQYLGGSLRLNEQFGTATLYLEGGLRLDLVTARRDFYLSAAALPRVEASSLKNDLFRRDFTINTLACSLMTHNFGKFYDFFSGGHDLKLGRLRTLYNLSFVDDPLRILRAVRFAVRFGFTIETETRTLMLKAIRSRILEKVSRQRLNNEMSMIYAEKSPPEILRYLDELGLLPSIYPRLQTDPETWTRLQQTQKGLLWARSRQWPGTYRAESVYTAALIYALKQGERALLLRRLQPPKTFSVVVTAVCNGVPIALAQLRDERLPPSAIAALLEPLPIEGLILLYALGEAGHVRKQLLFHLDQLRHRRPHLTGKDLCAAGLQPGPLYREILGELKNAVLDGLACTPAKERALLQTLLKQHTTPAAGSKPEEGGA